MPDFAYIEHCSIQQTTKQTDTHEYYVRAFVVAGIIFFPSRRQQYLFTNTHARY